MNPFECVFWEGWTHQMISPLVRTKSNQSINKWSDTPEINIVEKNILDMFTATPLEMDLILQRTGNKNGGGNGIPTNGCRNGIPVMLLPLTKELIYRRLVIINAEFSTNAEKGCLILHDMADAIWAECQDANNAHTDAELVRKAEDYIQQCLNPTANVSLHPIQILLDKAFGWKMITHGKTNKTYTIESVNQTSLLSKYLHYSLEAADSKTGFPIYDRLLREGILKGKSFIRNTKVCNKIKTVMAEPCFVKTEFSNVPVYMHALYRIGNELAVRGSANWSYFHALDRLLWSIAKVADARYTSSPNKIMPHQVLNGTPTYNMAKLHLLMTRTEFDAVVQYYQNPINNLYQPKIAGIPMTQAEFANAVAPFYKNNNQHIITRIQSML